MIVTTGLDDCEVDLLVKHLEEITYSMDPFITRSMKIKKFLLDLMKKYLDDKSSLSKGDIIDEIKEIDSLALKKHGKMSPDEYKQRLQDEIDELTKAFGSIEHAFELFDVIAFTYAYFVNGLGIPHKHFESLLLEKARIVKDRLKVPEKVELCPKEKEGDL